MDTKMKHELPKLPYSLNALQPVLSKETLDYHYNKHHAGYINKLNALIGADQDCSDKSLEDLILNKVPGDPIFNNAAQIWNHTFYWNSLCPGGSDEPSGELREKIEQSFTDFNNLKKEFIEAATGKFGSGWVWIYRDQADTLKITTTDDADCIIRFDQTPLIVCDVWEHAYYIDYRNNRGEYLEKLWGLINWDFAENNFLSVK
ncbi:MAG: superoxide dismutase [Fe] [marine bacterium B5-7]|nr:MAG: superoxide dismutase [Fe] [marine bacterium B5-7]